jgi:hypothetical protein
VTRPPSPTNPPGKTTLPSGGKITPPKQAGGMKNPGKKYKNLLMF